jgi:hypothetical protein
MLRGLAPQIVLIDAQEPLRNNRYMF